jgi:hypothetical protein
MKSFVGYCSAVFFLAFALVLHAEPSASLVPYDLRVDNRSAPLGIDSIGPNFSWKLRSVSADSRAARQTAWQIRVGTSRESADVWDSGQIASSNQLNVKYAGRPLRSHEALFWQVRVWDEQGKPSDWSKSATFTMGVLTVADWAPARWITDPALVGWQRTKLGYSSKDSSDGSVSKWFQFDLGSVRRVDRVRLYPIRHTVPENFGFPARFKLEASDDPGFTSPHLIADYTTKNYAFYPSYSIDLEVGNLAARYLRFTFPRKGRVAFAQAEVLSAGKNIAVQATVSASESLEDERWGAASVVDGLAVPGGNPWANSTLRLRREFPVRSGLQRALLHVSGLGQYSLHLNGHAADNGLLTPGWTTYEKTVLYDSYDVTPQLHPGANALGIELASGMFNVQPGRYVKFVSAFRPLIAIAQLRLEYTDGSVDTVVTDPSWRVTFGPVTFSNIFGGEDYDARIEPKGWDSAGFDDHTWTPASLHDGLGGELRGASHASPPFRTFEVLKPVASHELRRGVTVYDLGQNASLTLHLRVKGSAGSKLKILPSELLREDGSLNRSTVGNAEASWNYTLAGDVESEDWRPPYFYHGARYLQVECFPATAGDALPKLELIEGIVTHSDSSPAGEFACSSDLFNRIRLLIHWAQRSNLAHVISDCPHRERLGWLEQYHLNGPALRYEWDLTQLYSKCFDDMADAQTADGLVPDIAPEFVKFGGGFRDSPEWGSAFILAAWQHYVWTADDAPLRRHFDAMRRYFDYLTSKSKDQLLNHGLGDWYDRGPKAPGPSQLTPIALTATAIYYEDAVTLARIAKYLDREDLAREFTQHAAEIKTAFNRAFLDSKTGTYATGSQTAQALPLVLDLVPAEQRDRAIAILVRDIESRGHAVTAGDVGYRYVLRALADGGRSDVIFTMINQSDKPGYGYQLAHGATSLTEAWDANPTSSQNHFMLGQIMEWFYGDLAGLAPDPTAPGFARVIIKPQPLPGIDWARARHESPRGPITVEWRKDGTRFTLHVDLPPNTTALVHLPAATNAQIQEHGASLEKTVGVKIVRRDANTTVLEVSSGSYEFVSTQP